MEHPQPKNWLESQTEPEILSENRQGDVVDLEIYVSSSLYQFQGHFPETPIFPGVAQVDWAARLAKQYFVYDGHVSGLGQIKFASLIHANCRLHLRIEFQREKHRISFTYHHGEDLCSSGYLDLSGK